MFYSVFNGTLEEKGYFYGRESSFRTGWGGELILIALGMTATILAYDLAKAGLWAIDIGHIDVEYEWFIRGATEKVALNGKFVNEAPGGRDVAEVKDSLYESQIIESIY